jgi:hypothetical protein
MKNSTAKVLAAALILLLTNGAASAQTRITFKRGESSAVVNGTLGADATRSFVMRGREGQILNVEVNSRRIAVNLRRGKADVKTVNLPFKNNDGKPI